MKNIIIFTTFLVGIFAIVFGLVYVLTRQSCYSMYSEYNPTFGIMSECRIEYNGKLTPVDMIKNINLK